MKNFLLLSMLIIYALCCINRPDAIGRAMQWVKDHVPYDAKSYHGGYIQGCQGIVGYAWLFPKPGVYSGDLINGGYCKKVSKDQLQEGDIMVCPGQHQLLFHSWANSAKTEYIGIQLGGPSGSIKHNIPWPYFSTLNPSCYIPCSVAKSCAQSPQNNLQVATQ